MKRKMNRNGYFDLLKTFAILLVINSHYVDSFAASCYRTFPFLSVLNTFSGKYGVSIFGIVSGYFAYSSGKKGKDTLEYIINRYLFFFCCCFVTNLLLYAINKDGVRDIASFGMVIGQSVTLDDWFCPTFWFIFDFLYGMIISFIMGKNDCRLFESIVIVLVAFLSRIPFIATVILGTTLYHILQEKPSWLQNRFIKVIFVIIVFSALYFQIDDGHLEYTMNAIRALALILLLYENKIIKRISNYSVFYLIGKNTMAIIASHIMLLFLLSKQVIDKNLAVYTLWLIICVLAAYPIGFLMDVFYSNTISIESRLLNWMKTMIV